MKAPAGGMVSAVNGQFYNGGEFIPDHGQFCGKGNNRVTVAAVADMSARLQASKGWSLRYNEKAEVFQAVMPSGLVMYTAKSVKSFAPFCS